MIVAPIQAMRRARREPGLRSAIESAICWSSRPARSPDRRSRQHGHGLMSPNQRAVDPDSVAGPGDMDVELNSLESLGDHIRSPDVGIRSETEGEHFGVSALGHAPDPLGRRRSGSRGRFVAAIRGAGPLIRSVSANVPNRSRCVGPTLVTIPTSALAEETSSSLSSCE